MITSFYNSAVGVKTSQSYLDIIANNISNVSTQGYKQQTASFYDLVYTNMEKTQNPNANLIKGSGAKIEHTGINWDSGALIQTGSQMDFAVNGDGFFMIKNQVTGEDFFTRSGSFILSQKQDGNFYLSTSNGDYVLDSNQNPIMVKNIDDNLDVGLFNFSNSGGMELCGNNLFKATEKCGRMYSDNSNNIVRGYLEGSNVALSTEMVSMIESQKAYQMNLRMVQTSDEIVQTINNLR